AAPKTCRFGRGPEATDHALSDRMDKQSLGKRRGHQVTYRIGARRLAEDGDPFRIASEGSNIPLDPVQCCDLIEQPVVPRDMMVRFPAQLPMGQKSKDTQTIVEGHDDHA